MGHNDNDANSALRIIKEGEAPPFGSAGNPKTENNYHINSTISYGWDFMGEG